MPRVSKFTLNRQYINPLPTNLELLIYESMNKGMFTKAVILKIFSNNPRYVTLYLRNPSYMRVNHLLILASILDIPVEEVFRLSMERANDKKRLKQWALSVPLYFRYRHLTNLRKVHAKKDKKVSDGLLKSALSSLAARSPGIA